MFGNISLWITPRATIWVVLEAGYKFNKIVSYCKWKNWRQHWHFKTSKKFYLVIVFQKFKKMDESQFFQKFWMNEWGSLIAHIYSVASIITTLTPKLPHSPIHSTSRRWLSCGNVRHSSRIGFVNLCVALRTGATHWAAC